MKLPDKHQFTLRAYWFVRGWNDCREQSHSVPELASLRRLLRPYRHRKSIALYLDRDEFQSGGVWAHFTGDRAWLTHFDSPGGIDSYAFELRRGNRRKAPIAFRLDNGQVDEIHPAWTVERKDAFSALEYFFVQGDRDPKLRWFVQPDNLLSAPNVAQ